MTAICGEPITTKAGAALEPPSKIAHKTNAAKNRPQDTVKNRLQDEPKNRPDIINPVSLGGVIGECELKALLGVRKQTAWCSPVRVQGLLLLADHILRHLKGNGTISISADLAHQFVSKLRKKDCATTITEPLLLLCKVGILEMGAASGVRAHKDIGSLSFRSSLPQGPAKV
jgi:hypothetical protein